MKLIKIVHDLRKASGTNAKLEILKKHSDNDLWKKFLLYTFDPTVSYNVSSPTSFDFHEADINELMFEMLDKLSSKEVSGNRAKDLAKTLSYQYGEIPRLILLHSIKAGVSVKTVNKAYPGLISLFETMKGTDVPIQKYPVLSSIKYDGVKVFVKVTEEGVSLKSSSGTKFVLKSLVKEFESAMFGVYEGELVYKEGKQVHRSAISGKLTSLISGNTDDIKDYSYMIYDYIPLKEWDMKIGLTPFSTRQHFLNSQFDLGFKDSFYVKKVEHYEHSNESEVITFFELLLVHGYEGSMHRYAEDEYEWTGNKRTKALIKKKAIKECVLTCVGVIPHSNPSKGLIGSLVCHGLLNDKVLGSVKIDVKVGSGLSKMDTQFSEEKYLGEKIEIMYNTVTKTDSGYSLFLPRFKRIKKM